MTTQSLLKILNFRGEFFKELILSDLSIDFLQVGHFDEVYDTSFIISLTGVKETDIEKIEKTVDRVFQSVYVNGFKKNKSETSGDEPLKSSWLYCVLVPTVSQFPILVSIFTLPEMR